MFKKYNSIENSYREEFLTKIKSHDFWNKEYVVQEKAHGSNLSFWTTDGISFKSGKRTTVLESGERFYNFELVLESIKPKLQGIWNDLKKINDSIGQITIFGELIGGNYPHQKIERSKTAIKVQKGVFYSPENCFYAFDILLDCKQYLDVDKTNELFEKHSMLYAKTIFRGNIEDCLRYPNIFDSKIPTQLGLPELSPNICEGTIIRPIKHLMFNNGVRVILKNKNDKWSETIKSKNRPKLEIEIPEKVAELQTIILEYVTENRLNNVTSKIGEVSIRDFGKVLGMFNKDVVEDFLKDHQTEYDALSKKEMKMITKSFNKTAIEMIKKICT